MCLNAYSAVAELACIIYLSDPGKKGVPLHPSGSPFDTILYMGTGAHEPPEWLKECPTLHYRSVICSIVVQIREVPLYILGV